MATIQHKIVIEDAELEFSNETISSVSADSSVSLVGEELYIDQFEATVNYYVYVPYVFKPTDADAFVSLDHKILCSKQNYDIRRMPYGTKIKYYVDGNIDAIYYCKNVERVGQSWYKINAVSPIGLMDKQHHGGGLYTGEYVQDIIEDILGDEYDYIVDGIVAVQRVYGWLPYGTKRENLHQLMLAYGIEIVTGTNGTMFFTFPESTAPSPIPNSRVYSGGKEIYDEPASRVEVYEHSYHYVPSVENIVLFDNSMDAPTDSTLVVFDQPIYADSISTETDSALVIVERNTNYAIVSGAGVLWGKPYAHNVRIVSESNDSSQVEKVISVQDATLVSFVNADNVVKRLAEYYFHAITIEQDIVLDEEKPGYEYTTINPFGEYINGFIMSMKKTVSSFSRATCKFITNYTPIGSGQGYKNRVLIPLSPGDEETWVIPQEVFEKEIPSFRVTLIGRGESGTDGTDGKRGYGGVDRAGTGGDGGIGGRGGHGGNVLTVTIIADGLESITLSNYGNNSLLRSEYYNYSSADGVPGPYGYFDILTGEMLAVRGVDGANGGRGGNGDYYTHITGTESTAQNGQDVVFDGVTYKGGRPGSRAIVNGSQGGITSSIDVYVSGTGGGGAAYGANGGNGTRSLIDARGGKGANALPASPPVDVYGAGGNGGHGGGGGGASCTREWWNNEFLVVINHDRGVSSEAGKGSSGSEGQYGCAIIYY